MYYMIVLTVLLVIALGALGAWRWKQLRGANRDRAILALDALGHLKALLIFIQQHRGLTTGYLHGDTTLLIQTQQAAMKVDNQWRYMEGQFMDLSSDDLYMGIYSHWQRLSRRWKNQTVNNNIEQHNRLITNLLYLIENQAENTPDLLKFARETGLDVVWKELLETIEAIGQTRAIGMGVVGAGESSAVERIQLKFLIEKVSDRMARLDQAFAKYASSRDEANWSAPFLRSANDKANALLGFVETSLLKRTKFDMSSETFFDLATSAIEPLDSLFGEATLHIKRRYAALP